MGSEIFVDINPYQTRVVLMEDGMPAEIYIEGRGKERLVGNIYKGKVQNVLSGMQAAFVDIGLEKNAFLYAGDIQVDTADFKFSDGGVNLAPGRIQDMVKPGQDILVQVIKEPVGTKGARVTTHVTLPGRTLVLMPDMDYVGVSRRIADEAERSRLRELAVRLKSDDVGLIVRTAAEGTTEEEFTSDIRFLTRLWQRIRDKSRSVTAPHLVHAEEPLVFRTIRDVFTQDVDRLVINDTEFYERVQIVAGIISPDYRDRVVLHKGNPDLFDTYGLEAKIEKALARKVWLKCGGYIVIDHTEALTTIDVNTGKFVGGDNLEETITEANCEAAREIARQLRLRDISGIIVIDFIDMDELDNKVRVVETLKEELKKDRVRSNVRGITSLGLVEMTRKKSRLSLANALQIPCPYCHGDGRVLSAETVVLKARRQLLLRMASEVQEAYLVRVHPSVAELIKENSGAETPLLPCPRGRRVYVKAVESMHIESVEISALASQTEENEASRTAVKYGG